MKTLQEIKQTTLTKGDLIRAIQECIQSEYDAIELYTQLADSIPVKQLQQLINDIANEEKVHIGEFTYILNTLDQSNEKLFEDGLNEQKSKL